MKNQIRVICVYPNFVNRGGAQDVVLQLAEQLNQGDVPIVLTNTCDKHINPDYRSKVKYLSFGLKNVRNLANKNTIFLSHHRKCTSILLLFKLLLGRKLKIVHVAHNTFTNLRLFTFFPSTVIAVSNGVKENLMNYFKVPEDHIRVIFNGIKDSRQGNYSDFHENEIRILFPGRICKVKQQVEIVRQTKSKIKPYIHIYFAGRGEEEEMLKREIVGSPQYHFVGFINMDNSLPQYDYVCLFSQKEGLPLALIYGIMYGKPLITNDLLAVQDVNKNGETGFVFASMDELIEGLNNLPMPKTAEYNKMSRLARKRYDEEFVEEKMISEYRNALEIK